jgi:hypothetical protein
MPDESEDSIALQRVPLSQDNESDELDHQKDIDIIEHFQSNIGEFESKWTAVLALITADDRLKTLDLCDAEAFSKITLSLRESSSLGGTKSHSNV